MLTLENISSKMNEVDDYMYFFERAVLSVSAKGESEEVNRFPSLFYVLWDMLREIRAGIEELTELNQCAWYELQEEVERLQELLEAKEDNNTNCVQNSA